MDYPLYWNSSFNLSAMSNHILIFSLCNCLRPIISKPKILLPITLFLSNRIRNRLVFILFQLL